MLDANGNIDAQLENIIATTTDLEPWRAAIVRHPEVIGYCLQQEIRRGWGEEIYLLRKKQMSGYHAELFSYVLFLELSDTRTHSKLSPLTPYYYHSVYLTDSEPHADLLLDRSGHRVHIMVESANGMFRVYTNCSGLEELPEVKVALCSEVQFVEQSGRLTRSVHRADIHDVLLQLAQSLSSLPS